ncbi:MAG: hypothetical protein HQM08_13765 [Candidatus Riflebacteria bacterium]|nr:hypothetical protein [Candidatus Riflebacteria bacterium]
MIYYKIELKRSTYGGYVKLYRNGKSEEESGSVSTMYSGAEVAGPKFGKYRCISDFIPGTLYYSDF